MNSGRPELTGVILVFGNRVTVCKMDAAGSTTAHYPASVADLVDASLVLAAWLGLADDQWNFQEVARGVRNLAVPLLSEHFGERCPEFHTDCEICRRWSALDLLTSNPFE